METIAWVPQSLSMNDDSLPIYSTLASDTDLQEIVRLFVDEMPERTAVFETCLVSGNLTELVRAAHQLKGAAGSYGFAELSAAAAALELTIKSEHGQEAITAATANLIARCRRATALPAPTES